MELLSMLSYSYSFQLHPKRKTSAETLHGEVPKRDFTTQNTLLYNTLSRTIDFARAAVGTFLVVDDRISTVDGDRILRTVFHALLTGDTTDFTVLHNRFTLVRIHTSDV